MDHRDTGANAGGIYLFLPFTMENTFKVVENVFWDVLLKQ
jgi:hypothetical protein